MMNIQATLFAIMALTMAFSLFFGSIRNFVAGDPERNYPPVWIRLWRWFRRFMKVELTFYIWRVYMDLVDYGDDENVKVPKFVLENGYIRVKMSELFSSDKFRICNLYGFSLECNHTSIYQFSRRFENILKDLPCKMSSSLSGKEDVSLVFDTKQFEDVQDIVNIITFIKFRLDSLKVEIEKYIDSSVEAKKNLEDSVNAYLQGK